MVDVRTVRRIASSLPEADDGSSPVSMQFSVRGKQFAWTYQERVEAKKPRQPRIDVLAVRVLAADKESLLAADPAKFFITDHYRDYPAILVRLDQVDARELRELLTDAWRCQAPRTLVNEHHAAG